MAIRVLSAVAMTFTVIIQVTALPRHIININKTDPALNLHTPRDASEDFEMWVCPNEMLEAEPCPPGTPGGIPKAKELHKVRIGCNGLRCPHDWVYYDAGLPKFTHTCPRHAVVAAANWRNYCFLQPPNYENPAAWCFTGATPWDKTWDGPSVERCCGEWVDVHDPYYKVYPTVQNIDGTYVENKIDRDGEWRKVIKPGAWEFNFEETFCRTWMPETEAQFQYFMQNLASWDIDDADLEGHGGPRFHIKWDKDQSRGHLPD